MIFVQVRLLHKLTYSIKSRLFAQNQNPGQKVRVWAQIGVLQFPL